MVDVDHFKDINDNYGHVAGDSVLKELGVRWGGDEFSGIFPATTGEQVQVFAERLRNLVATHEFCCKVTISIGITTTNIATGLNQFVKKADKALYRAKQIRNSVM